MSTVYKAPNAAAMSSRQFSEDSLDMKTTPRQRNSRWNPRYWSKRAWIIAAVLAVLVLVAVIVGAVEGTKQDAYPTYTKLNYSLRDTFQGSNFFDNFDYFTGYDPSGGFVHYVDAEGSVLQNLTFASSSSAILRVNNTETDAITGRHSARITSKNTYNDGLFIFDILHTPYGCASWPALWLTDPSNWPNNGEIDVVEAVNNATTGNQMTLHTTKGCSMKVKREETGSVATTDCYNGTDKNAGCGVKGPADTYGPLMNANGGGVYAMELRSAGIRVWFFGRNSIPIDITAATSPDPSTWGTPLADFPGTDCNIGNHFRNQSIIANIDICGPWAAATSVYSGINDCPSNCNDYAAQNPSAFNEAYWEFASFRVFQASS